MGRKIEVLLWIDGWMQSKALRLLVFVLFSFVDAWAFFMSIYATLAFAIIPVLLGFGLACLFKKKMLLIVLLSASLVSSVLVFGYVYLTLTSEPHWTEAHRWLWHLWCTFLESELFVSVVLSITCFFLNLLLSVLGCVPSFLMD